MRGIARVAAALGFAAVLLDAGAAFARGSKGGPKPPEWTEAAGTFTVEVSSPSPLKAYVELPSQLPSEEEVKAGKRVELLVVLHGHGGTATGLLGYAKPIAEERGAIVLACEGSGLEKTDRGDGHSWGANDVGGVLACLDATLSKFPVNPKRVVLMGHSAGGTMSLRTHAARPSAFAGVYTTAAPTTPDGSNKGARVVVNLGTKDANYGGFPAAKSAAEKTVVGRAVAVVGLGHDLPDVAYSKEAVAWLLDSKAASETLFLPLDPSDPAPAPPETPAAKGKGKAFRHLLKFAAGGRNAPADAPPKTLVKATVVDLATAARDAPSKFDDLATSRSDDPLSKDAGGRVTGLVLARYGGPLAAAMGKTKAADVSQPFESDAGLHLVTRDP